MNILLLMIYIGIAFTLSLSTLAILLAAKQHRDHEQLQQRLNQIWFE